MVVIRTFADQAVHDKWLQVDFCSPSSEELPDFDRKHKEERLRKKKECERQKETTAEKKRDASEIATSPPPPAQSTLSPAKPTDIMPTLTPQSGIQNPSRPYTAPLWEAKIARLTAQQRGLLQQLARAAIEEQVEASKKTRSSEDQGSTSHHFQATSRDEDSARTEVEDVVEIMDATEEIDENQPQDINPHANSNAQLAVHVGNVSPILVLFTARTMACIVLSKPLPIQIADAMEDLTREFPDCTRRSLLIRCSVAIETMKEVMKALMRPSLEQDEAEEQGPGKGRSKATRNPPGKSVRTGGMVLADGKFVNLILTSNGQYRTPMYPEPRRPFDNPRVIPSRLRLALQRLLQTPGQLRRFDANESFRIAGITEDWAETAELAEVAFLSMVDTAYKILAASAPQGINMPPPCVSISTVRLHQMIPQDHNYPSFTRRDDE